MRIDTTTSINPPTLQIRPGGVREIRIEIDFSGWQRKGGASFSHEVHLELDARTSQSDKAKKWVLHGTVHLPYVMTPPFVDFGEVGSWTMPFEPRRVSISVSPRVKHLIPKCDERYARIGFEKMDPADTNRFELTVIPNRALPAGPFKFGVPINVISDTDEEFISDSLRVSGIVLDEVQFIPGEASFGISSVGNTLEEAMILTARTGDEFTIEAVAPYGDGLSIVSTSEGLANSHTIVLRQEVLATGQQRGQIDVWLNIGPARHRCVPVRTAYYGTPPDSGSEVSSAAVVDRSGEPPD